MSELTELTGASALMALLEIQFDEIGATCVRGSVAADERHHQPWGIVHGGLYTTAIETFATTGAHAAVKDQGQQAVGVANSTDFLRPHRNSRSGLSLCQSIREERSSSVRSRCADQKTRSLSPAVRCVSRTSELLLPESATGPAGTA